MNINHLDICIPFLQHSTQCVEYIQLLNCKKKTRKYKYNSSSELVRKWCTVAITATQTPFGGTITLVVSMDAARERKRVQCILASQRASSLSVLTFSLFFSPFSCILLSLLPQRSLPLSLSCSTAKRPARRCIPRFGNPGSRMTLLSDRLISMS